MLANYYFVGKEQVFSKMQSCEFYQILLKGVIRVLHKSYNIMFKSWFKIRVLFQMQFFKQCIITQPPVVTSIEWNITILSKISWWSIDKLCFLFCDYFMHSFGSLFTDFFSIGVELSFFTIMQTLHCIIKSPFRLYNIWIHLEKQTWFSLNKYQSNNGTGCCSCSQV